MLKVLKLHPNAIIPTVANPGEDLGFDLYALNDTWLNPGAPTKVPTGIAAVYDGGSQPFGLLVRDRSSMALKGYQVTAGVVDAGYRGEVCVILTVRNGGRIKAGDKVAQMIPIPVLTGSGIETVESLPASKRGDDGFGSTGR